jgi:NADPH:quinone reductase-like Zn-dependent oxidoreductase
MPSTPNDLAHEGVIGGRTVQIVEGGAVECHTYPLAPLLDGHVRIRTVRSAISPGTEMTFFGSSPSNAYLQKHWDEGTRLFVTGAPSMQYPIVFGYRACGEVIESRSPEVPLGARIFGNWRHTEFTTISGSQAGAQALPADLSWDDGVDIGQMGPICVNAVAYAEGEHRGAPVVVFGAGPIGLITAQIAKADGAQLVYVIDRLPTRLKIAESLGLIPIQAAPDVDVAVLLKTRHGSEGIPVAIEATGSSLALHEAVRVVRRQGLVVGVGFYQGDAVGLRLGEEFHHNGIRIACGQIGNIHRTFTMASLRERTLELAAAREIVLGDLPRITLPIEEVAGAFDALKRPADVLQVSLSYA